MASQAEIKCINKIDRYDPHERILNVGGVLNGQSWKISQKDAITHVESGDWEFFVGNGSGRGVSEQFAESS